MNTLVVLLGPTGVGKTALSLHLASLYQTPILSADSRQLYKDLVIGTAAPTAEQLAVARHYFIGQLELTDYYGASRYEREALSLLDSLFKEHPVVLMTGGSMMYIDAVCKGIDEMPSVPAEVREAVWSQFEKEGLQPFLDELQKADPRHYEEVDRMNYKRVLHAVEVCRTTGRPYSDFRTRQPKPRPFQIIKIGLTRDREELCNRINERVDQMMAAGLLDEAKRVFPHRHLNALNTVGYKELFNYLEGAWSLDFAVEKIKRNTRVYARKQMTWFKRDPEIHWFHPGDEPQIRAFLASHS